MRIGVDMFFAQGSLARAGIGNYSFDHIWHLQQSPDVEMIPFQPIYEGMTRSQYVRELSAFIAENHIDIFHLTSPMSVPYPDVIGSSEIPPVRLTATVFDLIPLVYPNMYLVNQQFKHDYHQRLQMLHRIDRLFAISEFTRQDFIRKGFAPERITTIGTGGSEFFYQLPDAHIDDFTGVFPIDKPFVLAFSPIDFRKNIRRTVQGFAMATRGQPKDYQLVVIGDAPNDLRSELRQLAATHGRPGAVHFTGYVTKSHLLRLYNRADAVALPSLYEGWGLPVLEALQCGTPVITSNSTSLPEVAGEAAVYVNPEDVQSIRDGFTHLLFVSGIRKTLASIAPSVAMRHQWRDVAHTTIQVFTELMAGVPLPARSPHVVNERGTIQLQPNRYRLVRRGPKGRKVPVTYVSFNLQEVPADAKILRAVMHFPMGRGARKPLVRGINAGWSVASVAKRRPLARKLKNGGMGRVTRRGRGVSGEAVLHWPCTVLARRWRRLPLRNHGVMVRRAMKRVPVLTVTYARKSTVYR